MALQYDSDGFIIGRSIKESTDELARGQMQQLRVQQTMQRDIRAIASALKVGGRSGGNDAQSPRTAVAEQRRVSMSPTGRAIIRSEARTAVRASSEAARAFANTAQRDGRGRFIAGTGSGGKKKTDDDEGGGRLAAALDRLKDKMGQMSSAIDAAEQMDPAAQSAKELSDVVKPLGRGLMGMFGITAERKKERWYNRIWTAIKDGKPKDPRAKGGIAASAAGGGGGMFAALGAGAVSKFGKLAGLAKKIPLLGLLFAGGSALGSMFGMFDDPNKSAEENRAGRYKGAGQAIGMGAGGIAGAALGSALGPLGTIAGGYLGAMLGEKLGGAVGDWSRQLVDSDLPGQMLAAWNVTTAFIGGAWDSLATDAKTQWSAISAKASKWLDTAQLTIDSMSTAFAGAATAINSWVKDKLGIDISATASKAWDATKGAASGAYQAAKTGAGNAYNAAKDWAGENAHKFVPETVKRAYNAGSAAATQAKAGYDDKRGNPSTAPAPQGAVQNGARAAGGAAGSAVNRVVGSGAGYNVVELADGSVVRQDGARNWRNNNPGNIEAGAFASKYGAVGGDGRFAVFPSYEAGRSAKEALIFGGANYKDKNLTDAISRYAPEFENDTGAYQKSVLASVGGSNKRMSAYTPAERRAIMDAMEKVEGFKVGKTSQISAPTVAGSMPAGRGPAIAASPSMSAGGGSVPSSVPSNLPATPEAPRVMTPLSSRGGQNEKMQVTLPETIGQNVGDRAIAHIVTGGIGQA